ncbi:DUF1475 family protein [Alkalibacter saccharofermentans]|uniref:DUF1475 domain-containing protein n=1 Tax=Alkalibacter saccharofermentans DSM 14828 TaxID=1120975 RepID=A0A1M4ZTC7_9FIRM|nr:DUF1475 family protein [Alkalibacter saccharofermentans]SHF21268.1 Protein of unknown function [Alkalibacter saccharofermentans DSM 14828]
MKLAKTIGWMGLLAMTLALAQGFIKGDFFADGGEIISNPWGIVSLVDLYVGFALFSCWIAFREKKLFVTILWIAAMMILGFFAGSAYVVLNLYTSKGDWLNFFLGSQKKILLKKIYN